MVQTMLHDLKESRTELKKIQSEMTFLKAATYEELNNTNKYIMEEGERVTRYLDHLKYLDKGYTDFSQYQIDLVRKDMDQLHEFGQNLNSRVGKMESDMGFIGHFETPLSSKNRDPADYEQQKYLDEELNNFNKSFMNKYQKTSESGFNQKIT